MASISRMGERNVFIVFQGKEFMSVSKLCHPTSKNERIYVITRPNLSFSKS
jgi:hypothetical protein